MFQEMSKRENEIGVMNRFLKPLLTILILLVQIGVFNYTLPIFAADFSSDVSQMDISSFKAGLPEEGQYVRTNDKGEINGIIQVFALPHIVEPIASFYGGGFTETLSEEAAKEEKHKTIFCFGGQICSAEAKTATRFVKGSRLILDGKKGREEEIELKMLPSYEVLVQRGAIWLRKMPTSVPDPSNLSGIYQKNSDGWAFADKYAAVALLEQLPFLDTQLEYWSGAYAVEVRDLTKNSGIVEEYPQLGNLGSGFEVKAFHKKTKRLSNTFVILEGLKAVYRITPEGEVIMIYSKSGETRG